MEFELMCVAVALLGLGFVLCVAGVILGGTAMARIAALRKSVEAMGRELDLLRKWRNETAVHGPVNSPTATPTPVTPVTEPAATAPVPMEASVAPPAMAGMAASGESTLPTAPAMPAEAAAAQPAARLTWTPPSQADRERGLANLESKIGQRWIAWVGAIVVFFSVVFFLRYAFQNDWIGPTGQVVISALGGVALAAGGSYYLGRKWRIFGQCLMGLGLAILYAAFYGAFQLYNPPVMGQNAAFGLMIAVTIVGMTLAVLHDAVSMAFLAVLGGLLTPVLVSTGQDSRDTLFTYMLMLDLGVMGVAFYHNWRLLDTLALVGTLLMYAGWWGNFYQPEGLWPAVAWLGGIYVIFLILPFLYHLVRRRNVTVERFVMAVANATFAASFAWYMLRTDYLFTMGFVCLGMAGAYLALGMLIRQRLPADGAALFGAITLAVTFLTLAVPMQLHAQGIMLAWVAEAPVLAFLAYRFRYMPLRVLAFFVLVVGVGRLFGAHWPMHRALFVPFANKAFWSAMAVPAAGALYALAHQIYRKQETEADRVLKMIAALGAGLLTLVIVHAEMYGWLHNDFGEYAAGNAVTALWALGALIYVWSSTRAVRSAFWILSMATLALAVAAIWGIGTYDQNFGAGHVLFGNASFGACLLIVAGAAALAWAMRRAAKEPGTPEMTFAVGFLIGGLVALLALLSTEVYKYCVDVIADYAGGRRAGQMSITLVWSLYAAGLLWAGFWRRWRWVRWGGLALFGMAALKLALVDLTFLKDIYRIVAFLVLGLLMLAVSYFYHRLEKRLLNAEEGKTP